MDEFLTRKKAELLRIGAERMQTLYTPEQISEIKSRAGLTGSGRKTVTAKSDPPMLAAHATTSTIAEAGEVIALNGHANGHDKIHWSTSEAASVAAKTSELLMKMGIGALTDPSDRAGAAIFLDCIRDAQSIVLQKHRRRQIIARAGMGEFFWSQVENGFKEIRRQKETAATLKSVTVPVVTPAPGGGYDTPISPAVHRPALVVARAASGPLEEAIDARIKAHTSALEEMFLKEMVALEQEVKELRALVVNQRGGAGYAAPEKPKLPQVGIFGVLPDQFQFIKEGAEKEGLKIDLIYFEKDVSQPTIRVEWALSSRWVRHQTPEQLEAAGVPKSKQAFCRGGISSMIGQLCEWFAPEVET